MRGQDYFPDFHYLKDRIYGRDQSQLPGFANVSLRALASALAVAILVAWGLHAVFIAGPAMRAAAHEYVERTIADEDRQFCEKFGMRSGSDAL